MCETTVYLEKKGEKQKILDDVIRVEVLQDQITLYKFFEEPVVVFGEIKRLDALKHTLLLKPKVSPWPLQCITQRRSIRKFTNEAVTNEQIDVVLRAAMAAPSAYDMRPWEFVVVRDAQKRKSLAEIKKWSYMCAGAPVVIAVLGDAEASEHWIEDCSAATENMLLAASGIGLGAVWVAIYPIKQREKMVREILDIPPNRRVLCLVPIGNPAEEKPARTRYEASKIHFDTYTKNNIV